MDKENKFDTGSLDLEAILNEFHTEPEEVPQETPAEAEAAVPRQPQEADTSDPLTMDTASLNAIIEQLTAEAESEEPEATEETETPAPQLGDTIRMEFIREEKKEAPAKADATIRLEKEAVEQALEEAAPEEASLEEVTLEEVEQELAQAAEEAQPEAPAPIAFSLSPRAKLRELKKKLVAGPEKRYYELTEVGIGRLQAGILINLALVVLCAVLTGLFAVGAVSEVRLRFVAFTQILAMLLSALVTCGLMMDGVEDAFHGKFNLNTLLSITFFACCADAVFCLAQLRVPCCAAFCLEAAMALWAKCQKRSVEISQMDTLRKAVRLHALVRTEDYYEGKASFLRREADVDEFMNTYAAASGLEKLQNFYAIVAFLASVGLAVFAGLFHGISLAFQVFSTSLLVAVPATFFLTLTRPMRILERRMHMVGAVLCGWQGIKGFKGKVVFPVEDNDLFPQGSTKFNGVKFYGDREPDEVVSYATSLIAAADGSLAPVFRQMAKGRGCREYTVDSFRYYDNGIGGEIGGESVVMGTHQFLLDLGVEIPDGTMVSQAVYVAIDGELGGVFAVSYARMRSSAAGLVSLCGSRNVTPILVGGDFMLNRDTIRGKFGVNTGKILFPGREVQQQLRSHQPQADSPALALATRDDLAAYVYAITGSRALLTATRLGMIIHLLGGILGLLIMAALAFLGATELLTPTNVLLYQLVWMVPGMLVTEWTRTV